MTINYVAKSLIHFQEDFTVDDLMRILSFVLFNSIKHSIFASGCLHRSNPTCSHDLTTRFNGRVLARGENVAKLHTQPTTRHPPLTMLSLSLF
jgi:hypothetical protein